MRNESSSSNKKNREDEIPNEKTTSGKKLVQARLPFKLIASGSSPATPLPSGDLKKPKDEQPHKTHQEMRKRKLSYDVENGEKQQDVSVSSKENTTEVVIKKTRTTENIDMILLDDGDHDDDDDDAAAAIDVKQNIIKETKEHKNETTKTIKSKGAGTPQTTAKGDRQNVFSPASASKVQIKLPLSGNKKSKRKKSLQKRLSTSLEAGGSTSTTTSSTAAAEEGNFAESSDDIEQIASELNPQKRQKVDTMEVKVKDVSEVIDLDSSSDSPNTPEMLTKRQEELKPENTQILEATEILQSSTYCSETKKVDDSKDLLENNSSNNKLDKAIEMSPDSSEKAELEADESNLSEGSIGAASNDTDTDANEQREKSDTTAAATSSTSTKLNNVKDLSQKNRNLTPKQLRLIEQRRKAREEKENKLQEEKMQKQREKQEKELTKKREREQKEEHRRQEREEKEEQRRKEREEKELKRLAEIESKNEDKRKRTEMKEQESRKKEEDRKRKEQEREDAEMKKKKAADAFSKFFVPKKSNRMMADFGQSSNVSVPRSDCSDGAEIALAFRPFQVKGDMKLAPICRRVLAPEEHKCLDDLLQQPAATLKCEKKNDTIGRESKLYLDALKSGQITPYVWRKSLTDDQKEDNNDETEDDVQIIEDELERAGQAIVEETHGQVGRFRCKFLKFRENRRPPYYGTWRKKSIFITPRRPFAHDKKYFDYEIDSDEEWEEEEPGESLDGSDGDEDKDKESEDDYEVDNEWFVPHGHLSEEELQNEDELGAENDSSREAQKAKLKILQQEFVQEMKKKTEKIKPRLIGCIWVDENGNQPELCPKIIWETLNMRAMLYTVPPQVDADAGESSLAEGTDCGSPNHAKSTNNGAAERTSEKLKPINLSEPMLKVLVRLIHGNRNSKVFLIKEFIAYLEANEESIKNGEVRRPLKSVIQKKIDEFAEWQITEVNASETSKSKKNKKRLCWIVADEILQKLEMSDMDLNNSWHYILQPKIVNSGMKPIENAADGCGDDKDDKVNNCETTSIANGASTKTTKTNSNDPTNKRKRNLDITSFTKMLTATDEQSMLRVKANDVSTTVNCVVNSANTIPSLSTSATATAKKRVPLLMSVARGQQFSQPTKNALISQFLKTTSTERDEVKSNSATLTTTTATAVVTDPVKDVIILD